MDNGNQESVPGATIPDRQCTWCQTPMMKRLVGDGRFIHYTCPTGAYSNIHPSGLPQPPRRTDTFFSLAIDHRLDPRPLRAR